MNWISVNDKLPLSEKDLDEFGYQDIDVLVCGKHAGCFYFHIDCFQVGINRKSGEIWSCFSEDDLKITHWAYLTDPE